MTFEGEPVLDLERRIELITSVGKLAAEFGVELTLNNSFDLLVVDPGQRWPHGPEGFSSSDFDKLLPDAAHPFVKRRVRNAHTAAFKETQDYRRRRGLPPLGANDSQLIPRNLLEEILSGEIKARHGVGDSVQEVFEALLAASQPADSEAA